MWLISALFLVSGCNGWSEILDDYDCVYDSSYTHFWFPWTKSKSGYWMSGQISHHDNFWEDRKFKWRYCKPNENTYSNTDFSVTQPTFPKSTTGYDAKWDRVCETKDGYHYAISSVQSTYSTKHNDRNFKITCGRLPKELELTECEWTPYKNGWDSALNYKCPDGVLGGISSVHDNGKEDRRTKFYCCKIKNTPMNIQSSYEIDRLLTGIASDYKSDGSRVTSTSTFGEPIWYDDNIVLNKYPLTKARADAYYWERVCPRNGAFTKVTQNNDNTFSFECATLIDDVTAGDCKWTDHLNAFHTDFTGICEKDGPIRGIQSYYSPLSDDRKFKIYCCLLKRSIYTKNTNIKIKAKTSTGKQHKSNAILTLNLCWNNYLYQGILKMNVRNKWFSTDDVVRYDSCGNNRALTMSTDSTDNAVITAVAVQDGDVNYLIDDFDTFAPDLSESILKPQFILDKDGVQITDVLITFPDDYLTVCTDGCTGSLYNLDDYQQYLITIIPCAAFIMGDNATDLGIVLRGLNGNLDKEILKGPHFEEVPVGRGNIGELIHINIEYENGPDFCIEEVILHDPYYGNKLQEFDNDFFGDGIILSNDCQSDGYFRLLTGIQYVPCYDIPFSITTYETSLYASVQIHSCSGSDGGISKDNSGSLSLTITGISKNDKFVSTDALSLQSSSDWGSGESRDYTLQISGEFEKISLITVTNNHPSDALCIDSVLINGEDAFLTHYWVGLSLTKDKEHIKSTIPAVLEWPICKIDLTTTIKAESPLPVDPISVATSTCVNRNRLLSVDCEISQSFETFEEISWQQEIGQEITNDVTMESGTETAVSVETSIEQGILGFTAGFGHAWSASTSSSEGITEIDITTDGKVNGETIGIECNGAVKVPPSQQIEYALLIDHSAATLTTLTDIKMTKCSAYLYGPEQPYDPNDYIYIYGIEGELTVKDATNCYVSFSQSEQVNPESITCGEERSLAARQWGTYVPQCDENDPTKYKKCQCAYGDTFTLPTCGCVDETSGNLLDTDIASVVAETDTYKWTHWCHDHCGEGTYNAAKAESSNFEANPMIDKVVDNYKEKFSENIYNGLLVVGVGIIGIMFIYLTNSCVDCYRQSHRGSIVNKYQAVNQFYTDTEIEKDAV